MSIYDFKYFYTQNLYFNTIFHELFEIPSYSNASSTAPASEHLNGKHLLITLYRGKCTKALN